MKTCEKCGYRAADWVARCPACRPPRHPRPSGVQSPLLPEPEFDPVRRLRELEPVARALVAGALANRDVKEYIRDGTYGWSEAGQRRSPTVRVEYEHTLVISHVGEGLAIGRSKNWGPILGVLPLEEEDPVGRTRMLYLFKDSNPYQRRFDQRKHMKERMGSSRLVNRALRSTLGQFLAGLQAAEVTTVTGRLGLTPTAFWRAAKGKAELPVPRQRNLFEISYDEVRDE